MQRESLADSAGHDACAGDLRRGDLRGAYRTGDVGFTEMDLEHLRPDAAIREMRVT